MRFLDLLEVIMNTDDTTILLDCGNKYEIIPFEVAEYYNYKVINVDLV